jgi:prevent-host-death family protein
VPGAARPVITSSAIADCSRTPASLGVAGSAGRSRAGVVERQKERPFFLAGRMKTLSLSEAKMKLSALEDDVSATGEELVITKNGAPAAVLVSPDELESWRETIAIRFDKESMDEVKSGLEAIKEGRAALYTLKELFED